MYALGRGIAVGVLAVALLTALKLAAADTIGYPTPFLLYFAAALVAAWVGGMTAGVVTTVIAAITGNLVFLSARVQAFDALVSTGVYVLEGVAITVITSWLRTARRRSASAVDQLTAVLEGIDDGITMLDARGALIYANDHAARLSGFADAREMRATSPREIVERFELRREDGSPMPSEELPSRRVLSSGGSAEAVVRFRRAGEGDDRWTVVRANAVCDVAGQLQFVVNVLVDITEKRRTDTRKAFLMRATAELNSSLDYEQTLATVARLAVPAFADWCAVDMRDGDSVRRLAVAHVDPAKLELVQDVARRYPTDPTAPRGVHHILRTGEPELIAEIPQALLDAATRDDEHGRMIRQLGLRSYIGVPITHGGSTLGVITFVTAESMRRYDSDDLEFAVALGERAAVAIENASLYREAERLRHDAQTQRDRLYAMIMAAPAEICVLRRDPELRFEMMNEPYRARLGPAIGPNTPVAAVALDAANTAMLERVFTTGEPAIGNEAAVHAEYADGKATHYLSYSVQPLRDASGVVDRVVVFANDVTEQVEARQRLEAARAEAEQANRAKDEFLALLGHELRNPLAPIVSALELMALRAGGQLERERRIIERQTKHMVRLVDDLLDISRITRGKIELARERVDLADMIAKAAEMSSPLFEQRQHVLTVDVARDMTVDGDPTRLAQLFANLLQNAAKYTPPGGRIEVRGERIGGQLEVRVHDTGIGISPEMLPRIFDLFVQERQALDRSQGGLGIGLAIVRSLVTLHGGSVEARSDGRNLGTTVIVRLPVASGSARAPVAPERPATRAGAGKRDRILVVDDNVDALDTLASSLELLGYETLRASDGPSALVLAEREQPRVALLDIGLPMMDGYELARRLRDTPGLERIALVAVTGYGLRSDRDRSAAAGFDEHLVKPVTIEAVQTTLERLAPGN